MAVIDFQEVFSLEIPKRSKKEINAMVYRKNRYINKKVVA